MKSLTKPLRDIGFLTIALTLALVANFAYGQWANPTAAPTGNNVAAPINTSATTQAKLGNIGAIDLFAAGTTTAGSMMRSPLYCDENGLNCWDASSGVGPGGGSNLNAGPGIVGYMRSRGHGFSAPPPNLSEWPDWVYCGRGIMPFRAASGQSVVYGSWPIGDNFVGAIHFNGVGNVTFNNVGGCGGTIQTICQSGLCGFNNGGAPTIDTSLTCNAYGCSRNGACSGAGCPAPGQTCNQFGCSANGSCTAYGCP